MKTDLLEKTRTGLVNFAARVNNLRNTIAKADYFDLGNKLMDRVKHPIDRFQQIITEANYRAEPRNIWSLLFGRRRELPETTNLEVGEKMFGTSKRVGNRFMWTAIFAAVSTHTLVAAMVVMAVAGSGLFALEFYRAKKDREDTITEINFAGQRVEGRRADLCRLHQAQANIMNLSASFRQASLESTKDTIARIMKSVEVESKRVKILDAGPYGAVANAYDFSRPQICLVNQDERDAAATAAQPAPARAAPAAMNAPISFPTTRTFKNLRDGWKTKKTREDDIVETLVALQKSLPPQMKKRFIKEISKTG